MTLCSRSGCKDLRCSTHTTVWRCCPLILLNLGSRGCTLLHKNTLAVALYKQSQGTLGYFNETCSTSWTAVALPRPSTVKSSQAHNGSMQRFCVFLHHGCVPMTRQGTSGGGKALFGSDPSLILFKCSNSDEFLM